MFNKRLAFWCVTSLLLSSQVVADDMSFQEKMNVMKPRPIATIKTSRTSVQFELELAKTPQERRQGLMFREHLADDAGMLFLFPKTEIQRFWMKNTLIPLDMIFIDEAMRIVGIVENAEPMTLEGRSVEMASKYVLEVNAGTCRKYQIQTNQKISFQHVDHSLVR